MDRLLLMVAALALLAIGAGMVMSEVAALKSGRRFFRTWYTQQNYWLIYFCAFVLGTALLIRAAIG